jgi:dihydroorotase
MKIRIRAGRVIDPASGRDAVADVFVADGKIATAEASADQVIDATGCIVAPGLIDLAARLREPGSRYRATIETEMDAAVAGGVTSLACPPDTDPPLDEPGLVDMLRRRAKALARARVYPVGALTVNLEGARLTEMTKLAEAGCVAFSQANAPLADTQVLWRALQYAATFGLAVWLRAEDVWLAKGGVAHDGEVATRLGLPGIPEFAETIALGTLLALVRATGTRTHVCIHHVHLSDMDLGFYDSQCRLMPPLRSQRDRDALAAALADGTIDCVVSDHTPVNEDSKQLPFAEAEPGATGLELLLPLVLRWAAERKLPLATALARVTSAPAKVLGAHSGRIEAGAPADLVIIDPGAPFRVTPEALKSEGKNSPFLGYELEGRVRATLVAGQVVYQA